MSSKTNKMDPVQTWCGFLTHVLWAQGVELIKQGCISSVGGKTCNLESGGSMWETKGEGAGKDFHTLVLKIGGTPLYFLRSFLNLLFPTSRWEKTGKNKIKKT